VHPVTGRGLLAAALATALSLGARPAAAHLIPGQQGTVNVVGAGVFTVLSIPASALHGADDDGDGTIDLAELARHEADLRAEIDRRLTVRDGAAIARTVRVDLMLSPGHGAAGDRADQIVALKHAQLDEEPRDLRVETDLFGARPGERAFTLTATRHPASGTETEVATLTPDAPAHAFFPVPPPQRAAWPGAILGAAALAAAGRFARSRKSATPTA
jgi:hypothetical protein